MKKFIGITLVLLLSLYFHCFALAKNVHITSVEAVKFLTEPLPSMVILDIRTLQEYEQGHLPSAILIDFYADDFHIKIAKLDRNAPYLLYCRTGNRTTKTFEIMQKLGFTNVYHMRDGITGWNTNEFPLEYGPPSVN